MIMSDDHASHAMSCYGSRINQTPNMDAIAEEGILFENCFCTNAICAPSRAVILTGKHSHKNGVLTLDDDIDASQQTFISELKSSGYQTAIFGKWHLGWGEKSLPQGFDEYAIFPGQGEYHDPIMNINGTKKQLSGYATDIVTKQSIDWMDKVKGSDEPFCLLCYHKAPHRSWEPDDKHKDMYSDYDIPLPETFYDDYTNRSEAARNTTMRIAEHMTPEDLKLIPPEGMTLKTKLAPPEDIKGYSLQDTEGNTYTFQSQEELAEWKYQRYIKDYLRCVASIDDNIGEMLDYLKEQGLEEDTIIIYTSDQGFFLGDHGWYDKRFMYEESLRMPFVMKYPRVIKKGQRTEQIISNLDFAPTLLELAKNTIPEDMQGRSFTGILDNTFEGDFREALYYRYFMHLAHHGVPAHYGVRTKRYKLIYYYGDPQGTAGSIDRPTMPEWELFDLEADPHEMNNVYHDKAYADTVRELTDLLYRLKDEAEDNL